MISILVSIVALVGAVAAATGFYAAGVGVIVALPWWLALAGPATLYAVLAALGVSDIPLARRVGVFGALCTVHAVVVAATAAAFTFVAPVGFLEALSAALVSFLPVPLIPVVAVPLILLPFRSLLAPPAPPGRSVPIAARDQRARQRVEPRVEPRPDVAPMAPPSAPAPRPAVMPATTSGPMAPRTAPASSFASAFRSAAPAPAVEDRRAASSPSDPIEIAPVASAPLPEPIVLASPTAEPVIEDTVVPEPIVARTLAPEPPVATPMAANRAPRAEEITPVPVAAVEPPRADAAPRPVAREARPEIGDDFITISLQRIADQLPADAFAQPVGGLADGLPEPGRIRIARARVVDQLPNGVVRVGWMDIAGQLPREAFTLSDEEIASRTGADGIVLPLDEVIRALPPEVLSLPSTTPDLGGLESFPLPFQPPPPPPSAVKPAGVAGPQAVETERLEREVDALLGASDEPRRESTPPPAPVAQAVEPERMESAAPAPPLEEPRAARFEPEPVTETRLEAATPAPEPVSAETEAVRIAAALTLLGGVEVGVGRVDGDGRFTVMAGGLAADAAAATVRPILPLLDGSAAPASVEQVTVRRDSGAIVLTPLGGAGLLVVWAPRDFRLALVEMRCREAAASGAAAFAGTGSMPRRSDAAPSLTAVAGGPAAELLARSMSAFGPLAPTVLRGEPGLELCVLLPPGDDARAIGGVVWAALDLARDAGTDRLDSIEIRLGTRRIMVRPTETPGRFTALGLDGDAAHRTGWAHVQMLHATARLEAA